MKGKIDDVLENLNGFGRYQKLRFLLLCLSGLLPPIASYMHSFIAASPKYTCYSFQDYVNKNDNNQNLINNSNLLPAYDDVNNSDSDYLYSKCFVTNSQFSNYDNSNLTDNSMTKSAFLHDRNNFNILLEQNNVMHTNSKYDPNYIENTVKCTSWKFEKKYYEQTLTEEV
jgi:hypothetical protein